MAEDPGWNEPRRRGPEPVPSRRGTWRIAAFTGLALILAIVLVMTLKGRMRGHALEEPPPEAVGHWTSLDPRYVDRGLRVEARYVILERGPDGAPLRGRILAVRTWKENPFTVVHIEYDAGQGRTSLDMMLLGADRMRLRNPPDAVWTRVP